MRSFFSLLLLSIHLNLKKNGCTSAFVVPPRIVQPTTITTTARTNKAIDEDFLSTRTTPSSEVLLFSSSQEDDDEKSVKRATKKGLDPSVRSKLLSESIAPWRTVRLFAYGALGSGAFIGGLITLSGVAAGLSGARTDVDLNTEFLNLAIDFGAVALFVLAAKFDLDKQSELDQRVEEKIASKKEQKKLVRGMKEREKQLGTLKLDIQVSPDGTTKEASVRELQAGAKQHMIIVAGPKKACRDALVGANLLKMDFAMSNVLVVPYETDADPAELQSRPSGGGFGDRPVYETQPYIARTVVGDSQAWSDFVEAEMNDAVKQSGEKAREEGIAIVVANNGKVMRRGIGKVPWRQMVEELEQGSSKKEESTSFF